VGENGLLQLRSAEEHLWKHDEPWSRRATAAKTRQSHSCPMTTANWNYSSYRLTKI